jgi:hypothetical protein
MIEVKEKVFVFHAKKFLSIEKKIAPAFRNVLLPYNSLLLA